MPNKTIVDFANQVKSYALGIKDQQVLGAWNLFENKASSQEVNGVTFTINADKSVTINGTATARIWFYLNDNFMINPGTKVYIASGNPTGSNIDIQFNEKNGSTFVQQTHVFAGSSEQSVIIDNDTNIIQYLYFIENAKTINNVTLYPMISLEPNQPYIPYAMTNRELTDAVTLEDGTITAYTDVGITLNTTWTNCKKIGNLVIANARFTVGNSDITSGKILTLPYTCINQGSIEGITRQANGVPVLFNTVANDNHIHLTGRNNLLANTEYILSFVYVTND